MFAAVVSSQVPAKASPEAAAPIASILAVPFRSTVFGVRYIDKPKRQPGVSYPDCDRSPGSIGREGSRRTHCRTVRAGKIARLRSARHDSPQPAIARTRPRESDTAESRVTRAFTSAVGPSRSRGPRLAGANTDATGPWATVAGLFHAVHAHRALPIGPLPVYERVAASGRMLPDGLNYIDSWVVDDGNLNRCFQSMPTDDRSLFDVWLERWADLGTAEVFPVLTSEAAARVQRARDPPASRAT
ncbi:MAG: DUF3303 domain-containing protein [Acidimicrobiia bacterium]